MNIGIDIDGVLLDSEKVFRTAAELYNTIKLGNRAIQSYEEPRLQEKYNWTVNIRIRKKKDIKNLRY